MGLRFQKRVRLFPGVRLNFSGSGVSASFGVRGASVTVGKRGTYLNVGIPGTGISARTRLDKPPRQAPSRALLSPSPAPLIPPPAPEEPDAVVDGWTYTGKREFTSSHPDSLSSPNLRSLADLASEAGARRSRISAAIVACRRRISWGKFYHSLGRFFLLRPLFTRKRIDGVGAAISALDETKTELDELLEAAVIDIDFGFSEAAKAAYVRSIDAFRGVAASERIWDIPTAYDINRYRTRSAAAHELKMKPVRLTTSSIAEFGTEFQAMQFGNVNGADLHLMPGFMALRRPGGGLALIDHKDLTMELTPSRFIETGTRAHDAEQVGSAWKKSNKDGSRDRRFKGNYQIPIMQYGDILITSATGLNERYMVTNWRALDQFRTSFLEYLRATSKERTKADDGSTSVPFEEIPDLALPEIPRLPRLVGPATAIRTLALATIVAFGVFAIKTNGADSAMQRWLATIWPKDASSSSSAPADVPANIPVEASPSTVKPTAITPVATPKAVPGNQSVGNGVAKPSTTTTPPAPTSAKPGAPDDTLSAADITTLQSKLEALGYYSGSTNGRLGKDTLDAFNAWRLETGRPAVANVGRSDLNAFLRAISR